MPLPERDAGLLLDMLNASTDAVEPTLGMTLTKFAGDKCARLAIERLLMIIGEAAGHVSSSTKDAYSEVPWKTIVGQRNILAHDYGDILIPKVYYSATKDLPKLIPLLDDLLRPGN